MSEPEVLLEARGLELAYGARRILAGVDLTIRAGESWFLLGTNGSGKTTLLRAILGLLPPSRGRLERHPMRGAPERLGFVPQTVAVNPSLPTTVREFVSLGLAGTSPDRRQRRQRLAGALAQVGLSKLERADFWSLSGGQRRRALLARALVRDPGWMVLDEPTEGLDAATEEALLATLDDLNRRRGTTLLVVTHDLSIAARHASHVALFHEGSVASGPRDAVLDSEPARRCVGAKLGARA